MIRKDDTIFITSGREKGKTGKVLEVFPKENRATVEKLNRVKRHQKPTANLRQGGIIEKEAPLHLSNLLLYCPKCTRGVRVGIKVESSGEKVRVCRRCREEIR